LKGSRHILQESSKESSTGAEEDGAEMDGMGDREEEEVKFSMVTCRVMCDGEEFMVKKKKKKKP